MPASAACRPTADILARPALRIALPNLLSTNMGDGAAATSNPCKHSLLYRAISPKHQTEDALIMVGACLLV